MTRWNRQTNQPGLEPYEVDAYEVGRSLAEQPVHRAHVVRREVYLDEQGRPVKLVEEVIDIEDNE